MAAASGSAPNQQRLNQLISDFNIHQRGRLCELKLRDGGAEFEGMVRIYWGLKRPILLTNDVCNVANFILPAKVEPGHIVAVSPTPSRASKSAAAPTQNTNEDPVRETASRSRREFPDMSTKEDTRSVSPNRSGQSSPRAVSQLKPENSPPRRRGSLRNSTMNRVKKSGGLFSLQSRIMRKLNASSGKAKQQHQPYRRAMRNQSELAEYFLPPEGSTTSIHTTSVQTTVEVSGWILLLAILAC